jgi:hypothetical protein
MKKLLLTCIFLFAPVIAHAQVAGPLDNFAWDYRTSDITLYAVSRFEVCVDSVCRNFVPADALWSNPTPTPPAGFSSYRVPVGAQTVGQHVIAVRACNTAAPNNAGCGDSISLQFTFELKPSTPTNGRFVPGE